MKSHISQFSFFQNIDSHITVTNPDGTSVEFRTPSKDKTFHEVQTELTTTAEAYIAAFSEREKGSYSVVAIAGTHDSLTKDAA